MLFTVLGLNLAGLFEFGQLLPSRVATLESKNPAVNAFLSGMLAVAIASPCTAPFMGASLGLALGLPAWQALLIFASIGVGMAVPYLAASLIPGVARMLPRCLPPWSGWCGCWASKAASTAPARCWRCWSAWRW
jgi:thiol:disulfide interchange protein